MFLRGLSEVWNGRAPGRCQQSGAPPIATVNGHSIRKGGQP